MGISPPKPNSRPTLHNRSKIITNPTLHYYTSKSIMRSWLTLLQSRLVSANCILTILPSALTIIPDAHLMTVASLRNCWLLGLAKPEPTATAILLLGSLWSVSVIGLSLWSVSVGALSARWRSSICWRWTRSCWALFLTLELIRIAGVGIR